MKKQINKKFSAGGKSHGKRNSSNFKSGKSSGEKKLIRNPKKRKNFTAPKKKVHIDSTKILNAKKKEKDNGTQKMGLKRKGLKNSEDEVDAKSRKKNPTSQIAETLMGIYEKLRRKKLQVDERNELIKKVIEIVQGKESEVIYKHDTVRVLEMCVKYGAEEHRTSLFHLFHENTYSLVTSKYGKFLLEKFMEHGTKEQKNKIIEGFYGKVGKLLRNKAGAEVLDKVYDNYASNSQKEALVQELYGAEFIVQKTLTGEGVAAIFAKSNKKDLILKHMRDTLVVMCQKDVVTYSLVHKVLLQYFEHASLKDKHDVGEVLKEKIPHILHTKDGARVAMHCLWLATAKDRKSIIKTFKTFVGKICKEEYGHMVMLALFDVVDDTVLIKKIIFPEIINNLQTLIEDSWGRKVILYVLKPRAKSHFNPVTVNLLQQGDGNPHSKKEASVRQDELRQALLPHILTVMATHAQSILLNKSAALVLLAALEIMKEREQSTALLTKIAQLFAASSKKAGNEEVLVNSACAHFVIKNIIKQDKQRVERGDKTVFSNMLCNVTPRGYFADWAACNRGSFVLVSLLETGIESVTSRIKEDLGLREKHTVAEETTGGEILRKLLAEV